MISRKVNRKRTNSRPGRIRSTHTTGILSGIKKLWPELIVQFLAAWAILLVAFAFFVSLASKISDQSFKLDEERAAYQLNWVEQEIVRQNLAASFLDSIHTESEMAQRVKERIGKNSIKLRDIQESIDQYAKKKKGLMPWELTRTSEALMALEEISKMINSLASDLKATSRLMREMTASAENIRFQWGTENNAQF